jgi:type 1 glutamine amidotransferase
VKETRTLAILSAALCLACSSSSGDRPAGSGGSGGTSGSGGSGGSSGGSTGGSGGSGGSNSADASTGSGGTPGSDAGASSSDGAPVVDAAGDVARSLDGPARPARVFLYTNPTPVHAPSIPVATKSLSDLFKGAGVEVDASQAPAMFTADNLARYTAVVMVNSNAIALSAAQGMALLAFVRAGGGLAAFHAAGNVDGPPDFLTALGATFQNTGGGVRAVSCAAEGQDPVVAKVPNPFTEPQDEVYIFGNLNAANKVVLRCDPAGGGAKVPASWLRSEGTGRVFYTTLGHGPASWQADATFLVDHAWPAIRWVLGL